MYEWLPRRLEQAMKVFQEFSLDWTFVLNEPASESLIQACELELGLVLPPSYREFLLQFNGDHLFCTEGEIRSNTHPWWVGSGLMIQGTDTLVLFNQAMQVGSPSQEWKLIPFCYLGRIGTGDFCALDPQQLDDSEYAVLDCDHELVPSEWQKAKIASSFEEWLKKLFNQVIDQKNFPEYWFDVGSPSYQELERETTSALMRQGCKKTQTGDYRKTLSEFNEERILESGNLVDHVLEEIQPRQAKITYTLIHGQEIVCTDQDNFDEFNENLTFSDD